MQPTQSNMLPIIVYKYKSPTKSCLEFISLNSGTWKLKKNIPNKITIKAKSLFNFKFNWRIKTPIKKNGKPTKIEFLENTMAKSPKKHLEYVPKNKLKASKIGIK